MTMKNLHDLDRMPDKCEYASTDIPWIRSYVAYIVLVGKRMVRMTDQAELGKQSDNYVIKDPEAW